MMLELVTSKGEIFTSTVVTIVADNQSQSSTGNYTENDPRRCYVLGEADACVRSVLKVGRLCAHTQIGS